MAETASISPSETDAIPISYLDPYSAKTLLSSDLFLFSQSGDGSDIDGRYDTSGIATGYVSRCIEYHKLIDSVSIDVGLGDIREEIEQKVDKSDLLDARWIRTLNEVVNGERTIPTESELREHGDDWPDYLAENEKNSKYIVNPRYVNNIYEDKGNITRLGVNDLSSGIRDCFDNSTVENRVGRLIPSLNDENTTTLSSFTKDNLNLMTGVKDKEGRITGFTYELLKDVFYRVYSTYEISDLMPDDKKNDLGGTWFIDYYSNR